MPMTNPSIRDLKDNYILAEIRLYELNKLAVSESLIFHSS